MTTKTFFFHAIFLDSVLLVNKTLIRCVNYNDICTFTVSFISYCMLSFLRGDEDLKMNIEILN